MYVLLCLLALVLTASALRKGDQVPLQNDSFATGPTNVMDNGKEFNSGNITSDVHNTSNHEDGTNESHSLQTETYFLDTSSNMKNKEIVNSKQDSHTRINSTGFDFQKTKGKLAPRCLTCAIWKLIFPPCRKIQYIPSVGYPYVAVNPIGIIPSYTAPAPPPPPPPPPSKPVIIYVPAGQPAKQTPQPSPSNSKNDDTMKIVIHLEDGKATVL